MREFVGGHWFRFVSLLLGSLGLVTAGCAGAPPAATEPDPAPSASAPAAAGGLEVIPDAATCQIWGVERLAGKSVVEAEALLGAPESVGPNGISAEWYRAGTPQKHVNPYLRATVTGGKITRVQCGLR